MSVRAEVSFSGMASLALKTHSFTLLVSRCPGKMKILSLLEFVPQRLKELTHKKNNCRKRGLRFVAVASEIFCVLERNVRGRLFSSIIIWFDNFYIEW